MINEIENDARTRMKKSVELLRADLKKVRTGRANVSLLDQVMVSYYGSDVPLSQVASVTVSDPRTLSVSPWEKKMIPDVEKAILNSDLGLNPATSGDVIRLPLPPLTEERRKEMIRQVRSEGENAKVAIRNIRRDAISHLKALIKDEGISKDEEKRAEDSIQKLTDSSVAEVDQVLKEKEADLLEI
jgi:ribosome recycling factor